MRTSRMSNTSGTFSCQFKTCAQELLGRPWVILVEEAAECLARQGVDTEASAYYDLNNAT